LQKDPSKVDALKIAKKGDESQMRETMEGLLMGAVLWLLLSPLVAAAAEWTQADLDKGYVVFRHSTLELLLPEYVPAEEAVTNTVSCALAQGQYGSVRLGIHALREDLREVRLDLESDLSARVYRPLDAETKQLLLGYSNPVLEGMHPACLDESSEIASLEKGTTSFFWVTLQASEDAAPGRYRGTIRIQPAGKPATEIDLAVTVRSFSLPRARIPYAPFFYVNWGGNSLPEFAQTEEWIEASFRDMAEHSHTSLIGLGYSVPGAELDFSTIPPPENRTFNMLLPLAKETGLMSVDIPVVHMAHSLTTPEHAGGMPVQQRNEALDWYEAERHRQGWPELATYGHDEPSYPNPDLRKRFESFREVRMRLVTAMNERAAYGLGDLHDVWIVLGGEVTPEMVTEAQRQGAEVWTYICSVMAHEPLDERHYAGLYVWAYELQGHTTWHYYAQTGYKLVWYREGDERPMPLVGWETRREGIDDYRYLQLLEECVAANPDDPVATEAKQWLANLRARIIAADPHIRNQSGGFLALDEYERVREQATGYIERLGPVSGGSRDSSKPAGLKDEAKPFRGKSVRECQDALDSPQTSVRRAAAWALFEKGPEAAPAVGALADLLEDAETRLPALRALEAIGPAARAALPQLQVLLDHPDGFVRVGANIAVKAIGGS